MQWFKRFFEMAAPEKEVIFLLKSFGVYCGVVTVFARVTTVLVAELEEKAVHSLMLQH